MIWAAFWLLNFLPAVFSGRCMHLSMNVNVFTQLGFVLITLLLSYNKTLWPRQLIKKFIWTYGSRVFESMVVEPRQQAAGAESERSHLNQGPKGRGNLRWLKPLSVQRPPPVRTLVRLPRSCHQMGTKFRYLGLWGHSHVMPPHHNRHRIIP